MAHKPVWAETDRLLLEAVVADLLDVLLRRDPARARHEGPVEDHEVRKGLREMEPDAVRIDDRDLADLLLEDPGALRAMKAELHVLGRERISVVELDTLAQLELVGFLIRADRPGLRQARRHEIARHGFDERIVDRVEDPEGCELPH